jgi:hypothetical protein
MPGSLVQVGATAMCPHGGSVSIVSSNTRVKLNGQAAATMSDTFTIAGCSFTIPPSKPQPCMTVKWLMPALRVKVNGQAVVLQTSTGLCQTGEQIPQGPPNVVSAQLKVTGT